MEKNMQNSKLLLLCWLTIKNQINEYEQFKRTLPVESIIVFSQIFFQQNYEMVRVLARFPPFILRTVFG